MVRRELTLPQLPNASFPFFSENFLKIDFIFWLRWVFTVVRRLFASAHGLSLVPESWGCSVLVKNRHQGMQASVAVVQRISCSTACGILVPWPGMEPVSPALVGGFLTTGPPGKSCKISYQTGFLRWENFHSSSWSVGRKICPSK